MTLQTQNKRKLTISGLHDPYRIINIVFIVIILLIFTYAVLSSPEKNSYPIASDYSTFTGKSSISSGLSHGFSCVIRGRIHDAIAYNRYSIQLFTFFVIQLVMRVIVLMYIKYTDQEEKQRAALIDSAVSIVLFLVFFSPFLKDLFIG